LAALSEGLAALVRGEDPEDSGAASEAITIAAATQAHETPPAVATTAPASAQETQDEVTDPISISVNVEPLPIIMGSGF
jgi:hypothetical protein